MMQKLRKLGLQFLPAIYENDSDDFRDQNIMVKFTPFPGKSEIVYCFLL